MKFWEVNNLSNNEGELILYGEIRSSKPWWSEGQLITPQDFLKDIEPLRNKSKITIRLNSRGGDVFAAQAIYTQLMTMKATKEIIIDGIAASAATIIAMAGDIVRIPKGAAFMIHNPSITVWDSFEERDLEQLKNMLASVKACIIETYSTKTNIPKDELAQMMDDEAWLTGTQAVEKGFCDEIMEKDNPVNKILNSRTLMINNVAHDLSGFKNMPQFDITAITEPPIQGDPQLVEPTDQSKEAQTENGRKVVIMTIEELKAQYPDLVNQIENNARTEAQASERARIQAIEEIANCMPLELVNKAKFEEPVDAKTLAFNALQANKNLGTNFIANLGQDAASSGVDNVKPEGQEETPENNGENKVNRLVNRLNNDKRRMK